MKLILFTLLLVGVSKISAQDFRYELTDPKDSVKLRGFRIYVEIDSVYETGDSTGVRFALEMTNQGDKPLAVTNPLYDTPLNIRFRMYDFKTREKIKLKQIFRWPYPHYAESIRPYRLERVEISGGEVSKDQHTFYWETKTLTIAPRETVRYELDLFEQVLADEENNPHIAPLPKGEYYTIFNVSLELEGHSVKGKPIRFKMRLE